MKFVLFYHSVLSCWNHGNAHFLRGICRELIRLGHDVTVCEPEDGWSRLNALADGGTDALAETARLVPGLTIRSYGSGDPELERLTDGADVVIVHEWNTPALVAAIGRQRACGAHFTLLFHDTHHRAVTAEDAMSRIELDGYDGVLAFGEVLREIYRRRGWSARAFTWHEAADTALFRPMAADTREHDLVWIGNWGDDERTRELDEFLFTPAARLGLRLRLHGVRYPQDALARLAAAGVEHAGWLPNHRVPAAFARARMTLHVPRRPYARGLPGIPTIRVFEALACGIPLICSPWDDCEGLFPPGTYLSARDGEEMTAAIARVLRDDDLAAELARNGRRAILDRHSCAHRAGELLAIIESLDAPRGRPRWTTVAQEVALP